MDSFTEYCSPPPTAAYTSLYFASLTFDTILDTSYPLICSSASSTTFVFVDSILFDAAATLVLPGEVIPSSESLQAISREMSHAYDEGMRSVSVEFDYDGSRHRRRYHFSKIRLLQGVVQHFDTFTYAKRLGCHMHTLLLQPDNAGLLPSFLKLKITAPLAGFLGAQLPLWKLSDLLDEVWPNEEVMSALAELVYFTHAISRSSESSSSVPSHLYLPIRFLADARLLYEQGATLLSPELEGFRRRLATGHVSLMAFLDCTNNHYSAFALTRDRFTHRDSLGFCAQPDIMPILSWLMQGTGFAVPTTIHEESLPLQNANGVGSGSCGLAAHDYIVSLFQDVRRKSVRRWSSNNSPTFRDEALVQLIGYHLIATRSLTPISGWTRQLINTAHLPPVDFCGYADFNMTAPLDIHPIHTMYQDLRPTASVTAASPSILPLQKLLSTPVGERRIISLEDISWPSTPTISPVKIHIPFSSPGVQEPPRQNIAMKRPRSESLEVSELKPVITILDSSPPSVKLETPRSPSISLVSPPTKNSRSVPIPPASPLVKKCRSPSLSLMPPPIKKSRSRSPSIELLGESRVKSEPRMQGVLNEIPRLNSFYKTDEDALRAVCSYQESLGFKWIRAQSKTRKNKTVRIIFRCNRQSLPAPKHSPYIDPSDHRLGKSARTGCRARVNLCRNTGGWHITLADFDHNHGRSIPEGGVVSRPPTAEQRKIVAELAVVPKISRNQVAKIVKSRPEFKKPLEPRQISNILTDARRTAREEVRDLGGDFAAILATLKEKAETAGWYYDVLLDSKGTIIAVFWQSDVQVQLAQRYGDILVNDTSYNRNECGYVLNIGVAPDGFNNSRNLFYALHAQEDKVTLSWVLRCYVASSGRTPETTITDKDSALIRVVPDVYPTTNYRYCLYHAQGNIAVHARRSLGAKSEPFMNAFWATYRAVSPEDFDQKWSQLMHDYPSMSDYMQQEWYTCRERWAHAWVSTSFTAGIRTTGRVEAENRHTKSHIGAKTSLHQAFIFCIERTSEQSASDLVRVRDSSRRQHEREIERIFVGPLFLIRQYAGPFALHTCYKQMELSLTYSTEAVSRPHGLTTWTEYAVSVEKEVGFQWNPGEEKASVNDFTNDRAYISTKWLIRLVNRRGHAIRHLFRVTKLGSDAEHYIAFLSNMEYVCDCCMGLNLGIPCRHYFQVLLKVQDLKFHIGLIRARWLQDPSVDASRVPPVSLELKKMQASTGGTTDAASLPAARARLNVVAQPSVPTSNPLEQPNVRPTETVPARTVFHEASAKLKCLTNGIQTQEDLDGLLDDLEELQQQRAQEVSLQTLREPPVLKPKGRPRQQRLTGALEGRARGGGGAAFKAMQHQHRSQGGSGRASGRNCGVCRQPGHNRRNCPLLRDAHSNTQPEDDDFDVDGDQDGDE